MWFHDIIRLKFVNILDGRVRYYRGDCNRPVMAGSSHAGSNGTFEKNSTAGRKIRKPFCPLTGPVQRRKKVFYCRRFSLSVLSVHSAIKVSFANIVTSQVSYGYVTTCQRMNKLLVNRLFSPSIFLLFLKTTLVGLQNNVIDFSR